MAKPLALAPLERCCHLDGVSVFAVQGSRAKYSAKRAVDQASRRRVVVLQGREVLQLLAEGNNSKEMASTLGVGEPVSSIEIDPEQFRRQLASKHGLWVPDFRRMKDVPTERLDAIATSLIRDAERLALAEGAGFGLGGMITFLPDASLLTVITLRLIQRLSLVYGFEAHGRDQRIEMWKAAAAASGIDYGKDLAEKQILEKIIPRIAERLAAKIGAETAEKWAGRLIPLASSAIGGALNFSFVRGWGRRVQRHLRAKHLEAKTSTPPPAFAAAFI
ncbi:MAG: hypothetical protein DMG53_16350 [Acidobacteria bacterium]|nr:MAG: hypothetical protein DMG53_16350 [Acidobacteriota bacterium]